MEASGRRRTGWLVVLFVFVALGLFMIGRDETPAPQVSAPEVLVPRSGPVPPATTEAAPSPSNARPAAHSGADSNVGSPAATAQSSPNATPAPATPAPSRATPEVTVSLKARHVAVPFGQQLAVVTLERKPPFDSTARVRWRTVDGSAKAGVHYEAVRSQLATFAEGQQIRSLFVPVLKNSGTPGPRPPRSFTIQIEGGDGVLAAPLARTQVTIAGVEK
jgi:hypothetical protein